jgi:hypothetical protein
VDKCKRRALPLEACNGAFSVPLNAFPPIEEMKEATVKILAVLTQAANWLDIIPIAKNF